jgi:hypothetical protein
VQRFKKEPHEICTETAKIVRSKYGARVHPTNLHHEKFRESATKNTKGCVKNHGAKYHESDALDFLEEVEMVASKNWP